MDTLCDCRNLIFCQVILSTHDVIMLQECNVDSKRLDTFSRSLYTAVATWAVACMDVIVSITSTHASMLQAQHVHTQRCNQNMDLQLPRQISCIHLYTYNHITCTGHMHIIHLHLQHCTHTFLKNYSMYIIAYLHIVMERVLAHFPVKHDRIRAVPPQMNDVIG